MRLEKMDVPVNAWRITDDDGFRVYGQAVKPTGGDPNQQAWFLPARGYMVQRADELTAIADLLRTAPELL